MTDDDVIERLFSEEGRRELAQHLAEQREACRVRRHNYRFHRDADRHDWRIPFQVRVAALTRANEHCEKCGKFIACGFTVCLELHHVTYVRAYGGELPEDLLALCRDCHRGCHA